MLSGDGVEAQRIRTSQVVYLVKHHSLLLLYKKNIQGSMEVTLLNRVSCHTTNNLYVHCNPWIKIGGGRTDHGVGHLVPEHHHPPQGPGEVGEEDLPEFVELSIGAVQLGPDLEPALPLCLLLQLPLLLDPAAGMFGEP